METELKFNPDTHTYTYGELELPSVTQVLKMLGGKYNPNKKLAEEYMARGTYIHKACEMYEKDELDLDLCEHQAFVKAWIKWLDFHKQDLVTIALEIPVYHKTLFYAGTIDRVYAIGGKTYVLDIKTGTPRKEDKIQSWAYVHALRSHECKADGAMLVYLKKDETYKQVVVDQYEGNFDLFRNALGVYRWRRDNKRL